MAKNLILLPIAVVLLLFATTTTARPCKTLFISYTLTSTSTNPSHHLLHVYRVVRPIHLYAFLPAHTHSNPHPVSSSLRDRAKDILVVVMGLVFGVGCGALTAATVYLAWSLLNNRYESEFEYDEIESPKKIGYASLPPAPATPASPVKEDN